MFRKMYLQWKLQRWAINYFREKVYMVNKTKVATKKSRQKKKLWTFAKRIQNIFISTLCRILTWRINVANHFFCRKFKNLCFQKIWCRLLVLAEFVIFKNLGYLLFPENRYKRDRKTKFSMFMGYFQGNKVMCTEEFPVIFS